MGVRCIGCALVEETPAALLVRSPPLRAAGPALLLILFGVACLFIAIAATVGLFAGGDDAGATLAFAFAGVLVLPLFALGTLFAAIGLWAALDSITVAVAPGGIDAERRWCGLPLARRQMAAADILAIDCLREARFRGIVSGTRHYRLCARGTRGTQTLADHLGAEAADELLARVIAALAMPQLASAGRTEHKSED